MKKSIGTALRLVAVAAVAVLAGCGGTTGTASMDVHGLQQVAQVVARGEDRVGVEELSHWIIEGRKDFVLIDLRKPDAFAAGHIQGAQNVPLAELISEPKLAALPGGRKLIVYSADSAEAAAGAALLRVAGRTALAVKGGYDAWDRQIAHPDIPAVASADEGPVTTEQRAIACYFVGGRGAASEAAVYAPKAAPASVAPATGGVPSRLPKRGGC